MAGLCQDLPLFGLSKHLRSALTGALSLFFTCAQPAGGSSAGRLLVHVWIDKKDYCIYAAFETGLVQVNRPNTSSTGVSTMWLV